MITSYDNLSLSLSTPLYILYILYLSLSGNGWLCLMSLGMMLFVIVGMLAFFVLMGWTLGAVEAVCLSIIVGLSVDYALHIGHSYVHSEVI